MLTSSAGVWKDEPRGPLEMFRA